MRNMDILMFEERVVVHRSAFQKAGLNRREDTGKKTQAYLKFAMAPCEWNRELNLVLLVFYLWSLTLSMLYNEYT